MPTENNSEQIDLPEALYVVVEASHLDAVIIDEWWQAALKGDSLLREHLLCSPELQKRML